MSKHYKFGGSTAARTLACPAWQVLRLDMPTPPASEAADLGTVLHEIMEACLNDVEKDPRDFIAQTLISGERKIKITEEHINTKIDPALEAFEDLFDEFKIDRWDCEVEMKMDGDTGGTADLIGYGDEYIVVADYKSGDGVLVDATENKQLLFYAMLAANTKVDLTGKTLVLAVIQPTDRSETVLSTYVCKSLDLAQFVSAHNTAVNLHGVYTMAGVKADEVHAGPHCGFCPCQPICPAKTGLQRAAKLLPADGVFTPADLGKALTIADGLEGWIKAVRKLGHEQAEEGLGIPGFKLVAKRAMRKWNAEGEVTSKVKNMRKLKLEEAQEHKLLSPAKMEKVFKAKKLDFGIFSDYISSVSSGSTLVQDSDKRPALLSTRAMAAKIAQLS